MHFPILLVSVLMLAMPARASNIDAIAAIANNNVVTCFEIEQDIQTMVQQLRQSGAAMLPPTEELRRRSLDARVIKRLQLVEAKQLKLSVSPEEMENAIQNVESKNGMVPGQLKDVLQQQGASFEDFKENMHDQILISKLINAAVRSQLQISEEAIGEYYRKYLEIPQARREVQVAQIFLSLPAEPSPEQLAEVRGKVRKIHQQLQQGKDFSHLVAMYSESPDREQQGVMGWFMEGGISQRFAPVLDLALNGLTDPIRSPSGFHVLKAVNERWQEPENTAERHDEIHARHILLQIPSLADEATRKKIYQRAQDIADDMLGASDEAFVIRAKEVSQGPSASNGGDLGWFKKGAMVPAFEQAAFALEGGETSAIVETKFGLHIIRVVQKRHIDPNSLQANHDQIEQLLSNVALQDQMPRWLASLRAEATISYNRCPNIDMNDLMMQSSESRVMPSAEALDADLKVTLEKWRKAWIGKDITAYLSAYADSFEPDDEFAGIAAWQASRRDAIASKERIQIEIQHLRISHLEAGQARLEFTQIYDADGFSRNDVKVLLMAHAKGGWRIIRETTAIPE